MTNNTFKIRQPNGKRAGEIEYKPLIYVAGGVSHRLALHLEYNSVLPVDRRDWVVSDPVSGSAVRTVTYPMKGLVMASRGLSPTRARDAAVACLDALVERIGAEKFNATIKAAQDIG